VHAVRRATALEFPLPWKGAGAVDAARSVRPRGNTTGSWPDQGRTSVSSLLLGHQLPVPLGDDGDLAVNHLDGGLIVNHATSPRHCK
jgi:hypothetical protein